MKELRFIDKLANLCHEIVMIKLTRKQVFLALSVIFVLSICLRIICWQLEPSLSQDGTIYLQLAEHWYQTGEMKSNDYIPPLYIYAIKNLMRGGLSSETAGVGINLFIGALLPLLMYFIAMELSNSRLIALGSALLFSVHPNAVELSTKVQREIFYLFFSGLILYFILMAFKRKSSIYWGAIGGLMPLAVLSRYEAIEFIPIVFITLVLSLSIKYVSWSYCLKSVSLFIIITLGSIFVISYIVGIPYDYYDAHLKNRVIKKVKSMVEL